MDIIKSSWHLIHAERTRRKGKTINADVIGDTDRMTLVSAIFNTIFLLFSTICIYIVSNNKV